MNKLVHLGVATALTMGISGCEQEEPIRSEMTVVPGVPLKTVEAIEVYGAPNDLGSSLTKLQIGKSVVATCYFESQTIGADSVGITFDADTQATGYAFIFNRGSKGEPVNNFSLGSKKLEKFLPDCKPGLPEPVLARDFTILTRFTRTVAPEVSSLTNCTYETEETRWTSVPKSTTLKELERFSEANNASISAVAHAKYGQSVMCAMGIPAEEIKNLSAKAWTSNGDDCLVVSGTATDQHPSNDYYFNVDVVCPR